jgi:hypothetical protein
MGLESVGRACDRSSWAVLSAKTAQAEIATNSVMCRNVMVDVPGIGDDGSVWVYSRLVVEGDPSSAELYDWAAIPVVSSTAVAAQIDVVPSNPICLKKSAGMSLSRIRLVQIRFFRWPILAAPEAFTDRRRLRKRLSNERHGFSRAVNSLRA